MSTSNDQAHTAAKGPIIMLTRTAKAAPIAAAAILLAALAGCSNATTTATDSTAPPSPASKYTLDPLSEYLSLDMAAVDEEWRKAEEAAQQCMKAEGFTYTPVGSAPPTAENAGVIPVPAPRTRDWVEKHGFGVVDLTFHEAATAADPNAEYVASLSQSEKEAYDIALHGAPMQGHEADPKNTGCATAYYYQRPDSNTQETSPPIIDDATEFVKSLADDPKVTAIEKELQECLAGLGYSADAVTDFRAEAAELAEQNPSATAEDPEVVQLKEDEIRVALADWECKDETEFFDRTVAAYTALEADYVAHHKGELEEAKLWLAKR